MNEIAVGILWGVSIILVIIAILLMIKTIKLYNSTKTGLSDDSKDMDEFLVDNNKSYKKVIFPQEVKDDDINNSPKGDISESKNVLISETPNIKKQIITEGSLVDTDNLK